MFKHFLVFLEVRVMSDFIESEAEESEEEFEEKDLKPKKTQRFMEEDGEIRVLFVPACISALMGRFILHMCVVTEQMKRKRRTLRTRTSREICVVSLMMEMKRKKKVKEVQAVERVTQRKN